MKIHHPVKQPEIKLLDSVIQNMTFELSPSSAYPITYRYSDHHIETMLHIHGFVDECCKTNQVAAFIVDKKNGNGCIRYAKWSQPYKNIFDDLMASEPSDFKHYHYSEEINCFFKAKAEMENYFNLKSMFENIPLALDYLKANVDSLNTFVSLIRKQMNSPDAKLARRKREQESKENFKSCRELVDGFFSVYSKLTVLRIDFAFKPDPHTLSQNSKPSDLEEEFHSVHNIEMLKKHIAHLLQNKRNNKILKTIEGYIFKFEHGPKKGFHVHGIFFWMAISIIRMAITLAKLPSTGTTGSQRERVVPITATYPKRSTKILELG